MLQQLPLNINHFHTWTSLSTSVFLIPCHLHSCCLRQNSAFSYTSRNAVAFLCINISVVKGKIWCKILNSFYMYCYWCAGKVLQISCQRSGKKYFQNSCGESKDTKPVLKVVVSSAVTNFTADNTHIYQQIRKENMPVWLTTSTINCLVKKFSLQFSLHLSLELCSNPLPIQQVFH